MRSDRARRHASRSTPGGRRATARWRWSGRTRVSPGVHQVHGRPRGRRRLRPRRDPGGAGPADAGSASSARCASWRREEIEPDGSLPITVAVEDRRRRTIGFGGTLSTIDGVGVTAFWQHRNLFGHAEQLRFDAGIDGLGGSLDPEDYDYNLGVTFTRPGVFNPDTNFITSLIGQRVNYDTYRERSVTASAGFSRQFGARLTGSAFVEASRARYDDDFGIRHFTTLGVVGAAAYDARDDPFDAHRGYYLALEAQPFYEFEYGNPAARGTLEGRIYRSARPGGKPRPRRPGQGRQLRRGGHRREPARPAVLRRRRRVGARLRLSVDRRRERRCGGGRHRHRRQGALRGLGRGALPDQRQLRRGRLRRLGLRHRQLRPRRRERLSHRRRARRALLYRHRHPAGGSRHAGRPARRRLPTSRSTSASGRRFEAAPGSAGRARGRGDRRGRPGCRPQRQRLLHQPPREPALHPDPPDPAERGRRARSPRGRGSGRSPSPTRKGSGSRSTTPRWTGTASRCCAGGWT